MDPANKLECLRLTGDTGIDEIDEDLFTPNFEARVVEAKGGYMDEKLFDGEIKASYRKHSEDLSSCKATDAYSQAEAKYSSDRELYKKDQKKYAGIPHEILITIR